jgi:hypothetical protein
MPASWEEKSQTAGAMHSPTRGDAYKDILRDLENLGRRDLLLRIRRASRNAIAGIPEGLDEGRGPGAQIVRRLITLFGRGAGIDELTDDHLLSLAQEVAWGVRVAKAAESYLMKDGGGDSESCADRCRKKYDTCINGYGCDESQWICICCTPCALEYMGCVLGCSDPRVGFGGEFFA